MEISCWSNDIIDSILLLSPYIFLKEKKEKNIFWAEIDYFECQVWVIFPQLHLFILILLISPLWRFVVFFYLYFVSTS